MLRKEVGELRRAMATTKERKHLVELDIHVEKERVASIEERVASMEKRATRIVDDYKASPAFEAEFVKGSIEAYWFRFDEYKEIVLSCFPDLDLIGIEIPTTKEDDAPPVKDVTGPRASSAPDLDL